MSDVCWLQLNTDLNMCAMLTLVLIANTQEWEQGGIAVLIQLLQDKKVRIEVRKKKNDRKGMKCEHTSSLSTDILDNVSEQDTVDWLIGYLQ